MIDLDDLMAFLAINVAWAALLVVGGAAHFLYHWIRNRRQP